MMRRMTVLAYKPALTSALDHAGLPSGARAFIFGSSARRDYFHDIDVGVIGAGSAPKALTALRDNLYDAPIPYKVDVVDFDTADQDFTTYVFKNEPLIWIR